MANATDTTRSSARDTGRLRVVLLLRVREGAEDRLLDVYEQIRYRVAAVPGYLHDQLCQETNDPSQWLITSEWESLEHFTKWQTSQAHEDLVEPLHACVSKTRAMRFYVAQETSLGNGAKKPAAARGADG